MSVNHYTASRAFMVNGRPQVSVYVTTEAKKYKKRFIEYIKEQVILQNFRVKLNKYQFTNVDVTWYFPRIDIDSNNMWKLPLDCLTESGVWTDDNTVLERTKRIYYDSNNPKMVMEIYYSEYIGIFENQSHLDTFLSKCIHCTNYKNGKCSVLRKSQEGRIQEEIEEFQCKKYKNRKRGN